MTAAMTDLAETIARLRGLEAKATPGPWSENDPGGPETYFDTTLLRDDFIFIAALRNAAPALLDAAERAETMTEIANQRAPQDAWTTEDATGPNVTTAEAAAARLAARDQRAEAKAHAENDRLAARVAALEAGLRPLVDAAHGLSFGQDWNNGAHAKVHDYRQKLLNALPRARALLEPKP